MILAGMLEPYSTQHHHLKNRNVTNLGKFDDSSRKKYEYFSLLLLPVPTLYPSQYIYVCRFIISCKCPDCSTLFTLVTGYPPFQHVSPYKNKYYIISFHTIQGCIQDSGNGGTASLFKRVGVQLYKSLNVPLKSSFPSKRQGHPDTNPPHTCTLHAYAISYCSLSYYFTLCYLTAERVDLYI